MHKQNWPYYRICSKLSHLNGFYNWERCRLATFLLFSIVLWTSTATEIQWLAMILPKTSSTEDRQHSVIFWWVKCQFIHAYYGQKTSQQNNWPTLSKKLHLKTFVGKKLCMKPQKRPFANINNPKYLNGSDEILINTHTCNMSFTELCMNIVYSWNGLVWRSIVGLKLKPTEWSLAILLLQLLHSSELPINFGTNN